MGDAFVNIGLHDLFPSQMPFFVSREVIIQFNGKSTRVGEFIPLLIFFHDKKIIYIHVTLKSDIYQHRNRTTSSCDKTVSPQLTFSRLDRDTDKTRIYHYDKRQKYLPNSSLEISCILFKVNTSIVCLKQTAWGTLFSIPNFCGRNPHIPSV